MNEFDEISVDEQLKRGLEHLANKIVYAYNTMLMLKQIHDSCLNNPEYQKVLDATPVFWTLFDYNVTNHLLIDVVNIFDERPKSNDVVSIDWLIQTSKKNTSVFPRSRTSETTNLNTHKKEQCRTFIDVDKHIKEAEEKYCSIKETIERVKRHRNKRIAHSDKNLYIWKAELTELDAVQWGDVEKLFETAMKIVNTFSYLLRDSGYYFTLGNHDRDTDALLHYAALGLKTEEHEKREILKSLRGTTYDQL